LWGKILGVIFLDRTIVVFGRQTETYGVVEALLA
jgi:hypothetical protein